MTVSDVLDPSSPRRLAGRTVRPVGLGCMNLVHGYSGFPSEAEAEDLLVCVVEDGTDHLDTATLYGGGRSEELVGRALRRLGPAARERVLLASKGGLTPDPDRPVDGRPEEDMRHRMPRFQEPAWPSNLALRERLAEEARRLGTTTASLAVAWVLARGEDVVAIPGTTSWDHWTEDRDGQTVRLTADDVARLDALVNHATVAGSRYNDAQQASVDTESSPS